jgi:hypothetical protein
MSYLSFSVSVVSSQQHGEGDKKTSLRVDKRQLHVAEKVLATHEADLMSIPGVVGVGIGLTEKGDRPAIHVYVDIGASGGATLPTIPQLIDRVPIRIIETDKIKVR